MVSASLILRLDPRPIPPQNGQHFRDEKDKVSQNRLEFELFSRSKDMLTNLRYSGKISITTIDIRDFCSLAYPIRNVVNEKRECNS